MRLVRALIASLVLAVAFAPAAPATERASAAWFVGCPRLDAAAAASAAPRGAARHRASSPVPGATPPLAGADASLEFPRPIAARLAFDRRYLYLEQRVLLD